MPKERYEHLISVSPDGCCALLILCISVILLQDVQSFSVQIQVSSQWKYLTWWTDHVTLYAAYMCLLQS
jgi:hypothetical protein